MYSRLIVINRFVAGFEDLESKAVALGDGLITVSRDAYKSREFQKKLRSYQTHVLSKEFSCGLRIISRSDSGRIHCHFVVALPFSTDGFDWASFDEAERWYGIYKSTKLRSSLTWYKYYTKLYRASMPETLRAINRRLQGKARNYGLGRVFVLPVRKNTASLKNYLIGNIPKKRQKRDKGLHYYASWGGVASVGKIKILSHYYHDYRARLKIFCEGLHLTSDNYSIVLKEILGSNWHWRCRDYIKHIAILPEGLYLPPHLTEGYSELRKTIKQHLVRTDQYVRRN